MPSREWDNIRLPNVRGRDAQRVPDGKLCSAGLPKYTGLDLPSGDWPATRLKNTAFTYRATIPHQGSFRFYVTRDGYSPSRPLRWADLDQFLTVPTPPLVNGAYEFKVQLPQNRTGRHLIYTVWQNTDTPDTYYSCTDVEIAAPAAKPSAPAKPAQPPVAAQPPMAAESPTSAKPPVPSAPETPETPESSTPRPVPVASSAGQPPSIAARFGMSAVVAALGGLVVLGGIMLWRKKIL